METVSSIFNFNSRNASIDLLKVARIVPARDNPHNSRIAMLYFYGADRKGDERIVRIWFYNSSSMRDKELEIISKKHPHLTGF